MSLCKYGAAWTPNTEAMSSRQASKFLGISKSAINDHRSGNCSCKVEAAAEPALRSEAAPEWVGRSDVDSVRGGFASSKPRPLGSTYDHAEILAEHDLDASLWEVTSYRRSKWQRHDGEYLEAERLNVVPRKVADDEGSVDLPALYAAAKSATPKSTPPYQERATVVVWADPQIGKTGSRGGTAELIERSTMIREKLDALLGERNPSAILIADAGDGIEGFESGGNPMFTNDLSLSGQLDTYGTELFEYINLAHKHAPVTVAGIPSNHAAWRCGKMNLGKPSDDLGLFMHKQVQKVTDAANMNVTWTKPAEYDESVAVEFYGTSIGLVHGNQFGPGQAVAWWQKQAFGAQAAANADVLVHGHYHSFSASVAGRNPVSGKQRYCLGAPTLDNGSDWFRQTQGRDSDPGLMVFDITEDGFDLSSLTILSA